jgi:cell division protein FtsB
MKVEATYWDNKIIGQTRRRSRVRVAKRPAQVTPKWFVFVVVAVLSLIVCLAINIRAFSDWNAEVQQQQQLNNQIEQLNNQNALLKQEVFNLKNDHETIEREARKINMGRSDERIIVPTN